MSCFRIKFIIIMGLMITSGLVFCQQSWAQYDEDQVKTVIQQLKARNLLTSYIELTQADSRQSATRADLLVACYLVIRFLEDNPGLAGLNQQLTRLQTSVTRLEKQRGTGGSYSNEELLVQKVLEKVEQNLQKESAPENVIKELSDLQASVETIKKSLKNSSSQKIERLEKRVTGNTIVASAAIVICLGITIMAAR